MKLSKIYSTLIHKRTDTGIVQLFRYTVVTGISFIVDLSALYLLTELFTIHYLVSGIFAYALGLVVNYALSVLWVFHTKRLQNKALEFIIFTVIGLVGMGVNELFLWVFTDILHLYFVFSRVISAVIGFGLKYVLRRWVLFS